MNKLFSLLAIFSGLVAAFSHFPKPHDHQNCEHYLLSAIVFALVAIALKEATDE